MSRHFEDAFKMSPALSNSKAEFSKLTFANMTEKEKWQVLIFDNDSSYVASPCYERLQNFRSVNTGQRAKQEKINNHGEINLVSENDFTR